MSASQQHNPLCDSLDINPDGIRKPCNCGAELSVDTKRRLRAFARECIRNSGGDPDAWACECGTDNYWCDKVCVACGSDRPIVTQEGMP